MQLIHKSIVQGENPARHRPEAGAYISPRRGRKRGGAGEREGRRIGAFELRAWPIRQPAAASPPRHGLCQVAAGGGVGWGVELAVKPRKTYICVLRTCHPVNIYFQHVLQFLFLTFFDLALKLNVKNTGTVVFYVGKHNICVTRHSCNFTHVDFM